MGICPRAAALAVALATASAACGDDGPWYDTEPSDDLSYLPLGAVAFEQRALAWTDAGGTVVEVDAYLPAVAGAPVVVMLPGAFVVKERYRWLGATLASHGVATFVVQPSGAFTTSKYTTGTLAALAALAARTDIDVDVSRVVLAGHSAGCVPQVGLTEIATCPTGFCDVGDATPASLRGLILLGYHNQEPADADAPMAAAEVPWLIVNGDRDGFATPALTAATAARIQDRPLAVVSVRGMNHYQLTDYVDVDRDLRLDDDRDPTVGNRAARAAAATYIAAFARRALLDDAAVADDLGATDDDRVELDLRAARIAAPTGHGLPRVMSEPFGELGLDGGMDASDVVASAEYLGARYLLVRNDELGAQVWRMTADGAAQAVPFPNGVTHGFYGNARLNGLLGTMVVFDGELYVGLSSGVQGAALNSTGGEVWAYDGAAWRPVVSNDVDSDDALTVASCSGSTLRFSDVAGAQWTPGQWAGAVVDDLGSPDEGDTPVIVKVVDNTATALTIELDELAGETETFDCARLPAGHQVFLRTGPDERGFGQPWNKAIIALEVFDDRLFVGTGFNYTDGAEVWVSSDGREFELAVPREFFGRHPDGIAITSSISAMHASDVTGEPVLYIAGTGTEDYGARLFAYRADGTMTAIADDVPEALLPAGFDADDHQVASMTTFGGKLWIAGFNFEGMSLLSMDAAGTLERHVGPNAAFGPGWGDTSQLTARLVVARDALWAVDAAFIQARSELSEKSAYAWRTVDGEAWQLVTAHAFGVNAIKVSQLFELGDVLYAITSSGALTSLHNYRPLRMYTLADAEDGR